MNYPVKDKVLTVKTIRCGQPRPYADSEYEYEIIVENISEHEVLQYCIKVLNPCKQTREQWDVKNADSYFHGYYSFTKLGDNKYRYYKHAPFCD